MKTFITKKFKFVCLLSLIAVLFVGMAILSLNFSTSYAQEKSFSAERFLPLSNLELGNDDLISPSDVYCDDDVTAVVTDNTKSLLIYTNGNFSTSIDAISAYQIVKKYDENTLLVTDDGNIYKIELDNNNYKSQLKDASGASLGCNYFDLNENFLVKVFSGKCIVYSVTEQGYVANQTTFDADGNYPVTINENNEIFYIYNNNLYKRNASDLSSPEKPLVIKSSNDTPTPPTRMVADSRFVYYIWGMDIYKLEHTSTLPQPTKLSINTIDKDNGFDLGHVNYPKGIALKGQNLLVTDGNTIQEFYIDNQTNTLTFSGFALANEKSAYNRVSKNATEIEKYANKIAILDGNWLKVVSNTDQITYNRENFSLSTNNIKADGVNPDSFSLGQSSALLLYAQNTSSASLRYTTFDGHLSDKLTLPGEVIHVIHDVAYQSGYYYALADNGKDSYIYRASEKDFIFEQLTKIENAQFAHFEIDVFENVYLSTDVKISLIKKADGYQQIFDVKNGLSAIKKLKTDLAGGLFVQDANKIYYNSPNTFFELEISAPATKVKAFALDAITQQVFFLYDNEEFVCVSSNLPNISFDNVSVPQSFITTDKNADILSLKVYSAKNNANVYTVNCADGLFNLENIEKVTDQYLYICTVEHTNGYMTMSFLALAGKDNLVLIDSTETIDITDTLNKTTAPEKAFVTTDVYAYFLPVITVDSEYALTDNVAIRLEKNSPISPINTVTFLNKEFYYAQFTVGDNHYTGYVPVAFTVPTLAEDFKWENYSLEKINATVLYANKNLTDKITSLADGTEVRIIEKNNDYLLVAVKTSGGWIKGYISPSAVTDPAGIAVRNALIIIIVFACVFGTTLYFIKRKKK